MSAAVRLRPPGERDAIDRELVNEYFAIIVACLEPVFVNSQCEIVALSGEVAARNARGW